jgi:hypothetical protein
MQWTVQIYVSNMESINKSVRQPRVGTCALNEKTEQQAGSNLQISRKETLWRLPSLMFPRTCMMPLTLFGGFHMCSRIAVASFLPSPKYTTRGPISLVFKSLRVGMTASDWTNRTSALVIRMR